MIQRFGNEEINAVKKSITKSSLLSGYTNKFLGGEIIQKFEKEFARFHKCKYGISVNSGTSALFVAQLAAGVKNMKKVSVPSITFTATTSQVVACGGSPNFVDIDPESYCMDFDFSKKSPFAIPVHLLGHPCNLEMIKTMKEYGMFVIEDCAQAMGAKSKNKIVGSMGDCGIFSFQETKHITTLGEGGIIVTNNEEFAEKCRSIRNHGEYYKDQMSVGFNLRLTDAQAAFGIVQLKRLPNILKNFRKNATHIMKNLPENILPPIISKNVEHSFLIIGCRYDSTHGISREKFLERLTKNRKKFLKNEQISDIKGLNLRPGKIISSGYKTTQYNIPLYRKYRPKKIHPNSENFLKTSLFLDIHRWRSQSEINEELKILNNTFSELKKT
ncbi:pyridoxal-phosphate-dependent enzyme apparently involved in regulation of cell wall biogenesis [Candidatus Nitrosopumilus koreensis AR1]|uniref:Pyridoxal-phosphate-dependent enzyme apparently involved in regulation of cell wall biogenesis n=1 Tax=Candidatus Nitrosopumilus koreensis AR1 TaxID=1229908 RepID=K0B3G3_9ARCH|nr:MULTISPECIES: DegT/DnrJ/EryC1/StrS family aminotransferase [Nitrosopumilus]AFS79994.1 pyridoxal-phosphate-dependent enzyme apparently involved in regulation of cell wall biogenesis [Candidatus Nitrosopumilus koreensis AR1]